MYCDIVTNASSKERSNPLDFTIQDATGISFSLKVHDFDTAVTATPATINDLNTVEAEGHVM